MAKVLRFFKTKREAVDFVDVSVRRFRCIQHHNIYMASGHYHAMLMGDITPDVADQLKGKNIKGFKYEP